MKLFMLMDIKKNISIVIPFFNEEKGALKVINGLKTEMATLSVPYEIIAVNDGSNDRTKEVLQKIDGIKLINHPYNKGYGAALKSGIEYAQYDWLLFLDGDGQHDPIYIKDFLAQADDYELIAGDRSQSAYIRPTSRKPGIWLLQKVANYLVDYKIPDLNCGLRLVKKNIIKNYLHFLPDGFSLSTTSTLAFLKDKKNVRFLPVDINKRDNGTISTVRPRDALTTLMLICRIIMLFSPLRIFLPASFLLFLIGLGFFIYDLINLNLSDSTIFIMLTSILIFFFGLIADQIASIRREISK